MPDDERNSDKRHSNLARIRDNQRRSRARRKEYLQELESKYRLCEQTGIEASAEIQAAARKVVDENRRLRQLLKQQGLSDAEINSLSADSAETNTANELESMLGVRKPCRGRVCADSSDSRTQSCSSMSPPVSAQQSDSDRKAGRVPQPFGTDAVTPASLRTTSSINSASHYPPHTGPLSAQHLSADYALSFDPNFEWHDDMTTAQDFLHPTSLPATTGSSSCGVAADAIRAIQPGLGRELEDELGCGDGGDCTMPNSYIFQVMDRYSNVT